MESINVLKGIRPSYNKSLILTRLGYRRGITELDGGFWELTQHVIQRTEDLCSLYLAYRVVDISEHLEGAVRLGDGTLLTGKALSKLLLESPKAVLMASTAGARVMEEIRALMNNGKTSEAMIMDAAASEIVDAGLDFLMNYMRTFLRREGRTLTRHRFSPGYGDFNIEQQAHFARLLNIGEMGITITETCMLTPEKSVLAIAGIVDINAY